jgi:hypothetical protein
LEDDIPVEAKPFSLISRADNAELVLRHKIWQAFDEVAKNQAGVPEYRARNPSCAPMTSDLRLDHSSGSFIFIELKQGHAEVNAARTEMRHEQYPLGIPGGGIFTFRARKLPQICKSTWCCTFLIHE